MCFFTHAVVLGVGYWIGKQYSDGYTVKALPIDPANPETQEFVIRVEKKEMGCGGYWGRGGFCNGSKPEGSQKTIGDGEKDKQN